MACLAAVVAALGSAGCATTTVEPGHRGLYFEPNGRGLKREVLQPGKYKLGWCFIYCTPDRIDDFDVTYSTHKEEIDTKDLDGLGLHLQLSVIYRPIVTELYQLDTEIGPNYYDEVVAPEFKSACRGVFAHHSYKELQKKNEVLENEVEAEVRRRIAGKHIEISSVTLESVVYAPEIAEKDRQRIANERETERQLAAISAEAEKKKLATKAADDQRKLELQAEAEQKRMALEKATEQQKLEIQKESEMARFKAEQQLAALDVQKKTTVAEAEVEKLRAQTAATKRIIEAKAEAEAVRQMAKAHAEERRAETAGVTPMEVMLHAYDALAHLGGTGTTIVLGDWAHVPNFLFPRVPSLQSAFMLPYSPYLPPPAAPAPSAPTAEAPTKPTGAVFSSTAGRGSNDPY
jgi:regulator of protease activity HflC (stomatin/prohibitin superfamily)